MTWTKLGDELLVKAEDLTLAATAIYAELLMFSNARGLDLIIPTVKLGKLPHPPTPEVLAELEAHGLVRITPTAIDCTCWHREWHPTAAVVEKRRQDNATRQERKRRHDAGDHSLCTRCDAIKAERSTRAGPAAIGPGVERDVDQDDAEDAPRDQAREVTRYPGQDRTGKARSRGEHVNDHSPYASSDPETYGVDPWSSPTTTTNGVAVA